MAKSARRQKVDAVSTAADRTARSGPNGPAGVSDREIARVAYDLYLARGCVDGNDVDDWLEAECQLRSNNSTH